MIAFAQSFLGSWFEAHEFTLAYRHANDRFIAWSHLSLSFHGTAKAWLLVSLPVLLLSDHNRLLVLAICSALLVLLELLRLVNLRIPALWHLYRLWNHNLSRWCHNLNGKRHYFTLTNLVPG